MTKVIEYKRQIFHSTQPAQQSIITSHGITSVIDFMINKKIMHIYVCVCVCVNGDDDEDNS